MEIDRHQGKPEHLAQQCPGDRRTVAPEARDRDHVMVWRGDVQRRSDPLVTCPRVICALVTAGRVTVLVGGTRMARHGTSAYGIALVGERQGIPVFLRRLQGNARVEQNPPAADGGESIGPPITRGQNGARGKARTRPKLRPERE
jgi:uncharacterized Zn-binding protein involved in type VI secretion